MYHAQINLNLWYHGMCAEKLNLHKCNAPPHVNEVNGMVRDGRVYKPDLALTTPESNRQLINMKVIQNPDQY